MEKPKNSSKTDNKIQVSVEKPTRKKKNTATAEKAGEEPESRYFNL